MPRSRGQCTPEDYGAIIGDAANCNFPPIVTFVCSCSVSKDFLLDLRYNFYVHVLHCIKLFKLHIIEPQLREPEIPWPVLKTANCNLFDAVKERLESGNRE